VHREERAKQSQGDSEVRTKRSSRGTPHNGDETVGEIPVVGEI
jgi:hypothetical protein